MSENIRDQVNASVRDFVDPYVGESLGSTKSVKEINVEAGVAHVNVLVHYPADGYTDTIATALEKRVLELDGIDSAKIDVSWEIQSHAVQRSLTPIEGIKNIIAVASGKGGVGKSTTAVNVALALHSLGARIGILDADIYGPSQPRMLGLSGERPKSLDGKILEPLSAHGVVAMSIGFLVDEEDPMVWRGPMVTQALSQLLGQTRWGELDYLIVDLPPGTGDIQLTLSQRVPVSGAIIVTTPQDIALLDARKGLKMFEKVDVPVLGVVENMGIHVCSECGNKEHIFGSGGGAAMAKQYDVPFLGSLPLDIRIREQADSGKPTVMWSADDPLAKAYIDVALRAVGALSVSVKDYSHHFPKITVENN